MAEQGVRAKFFKHSVLHEGKSKEAGRQIFVDKDYIEIRVAGMDKQIHVAPVNSSHKERFPDEWERYQRGAEEKREGTPVRHWPQITPAQAEALEAINIFTVEDMATAADFALQKYGAGARKLQEDARKFLSLAQSAADVGQMDELREAVAAKDALLVKQGEQIAQLQAQMAELLQSKPAEAVVEEAPPTRRRRVAA